MIDSGIGINRIVLNFLANRVRGSGLQVRNATDGNVLP